MSIEQKKIVIEWDDQDVTTMEYLQTLDNMQYISGINSLARLMEKHSNRKFTYMDFMKMKLGDFYEFAKDFNKKKGLESQYDFLAK